MTTTTATALHTAVIPAKAHSSRCPRKNWRAFADGRCLTDLAVASVPGDWFRGVIVSTDMADYQPEPPCQVHRRPAALATVEADVQDLLRVLIETYRLHESYIWLLNPTSPFRNRKDFAAIAELIERTGCPAVVSMTPVSPFLWDDNGPLFETRGRRPNTQDVPGRRFTENGMFYVFRGADFLEHGTWYLPGVQAYVQRGFGSTVDIDTEADFAEAARLWAATDGSAQASAADTPEILRNETLAVESLIREPLAEHVTLLANHFGRYTAAADALHIGPADRVLDASCGKGYGSWLLARRAGQVTGLDVAEDYLSVARDAFRADNLSFCTYDEYFARACEPADKIVCIETYEHLTEDEQAGFARRLLSALRIGGDAFFTCPLGNDAASTVNPFHLHEPGIGRLHERLAARFRECTYRVARRVDSFGQDSEYCQIILRGYLGEPDA